MRWDFRDSWNNYIHGPIAHGTSELTGGITNLNEADKAKSNCQFVAPKGVSTGVNQAELNVDGTMHYQGHKHGDNYVLEQYVRATSTSRLKEASLSCMQTFTTASM